MGKKIPHTLRSVHQSNIVKLFDGLLGKHGPWEIWSDWIHMSAIAISNQVDVRHREEREKTYMKISSKYSRKELDVFCQMLAEVVNGLEENPDQDFLGELYMGLDLGNDHAGQFFTPYDVCAAMAKMQGTDLAKQGIEEKGWIGVSDPACGAGALLVAFANECRRNDVNYQNSVLFVAQDIDFIVGCMCYITLSLLGCPGYVVIADSLRYPSVSYDKRGLFPVEENRDIWFTPFFFSTPWQIRCIGASFYPAGSKKEEEKPGSEEHFADVSKMIPSEDSAIPEDESEGIQAVRENRTTEHIRDATEMVEEESAADPVPEQEEVPEEEPIEIALNCVEGGQLSLF